MLNLDKNKKYLLACSFGPDSMALFDMLKKENYNFAVAHVNYGVRKEANFETDSLNSYCAINDVEIFIKYSKNNGKSSNFEAKARQIRYEFFSKIYKENSFDALLVAHNEDDFIETYYLQKQRNGIVEYYGIKELNNIDSMVVIRPLLKFSKASLEEYCKNNKVPYAIDSSNFSFDFKRNIIRHNIVKKMNERERKKVLLEIEKENEILKEKMNHILSINLSSVSSLINLDDEGLQRALVLIIRKEVLDGSISSSRAKEIKESLLSKKPNIIIKYNKEYSFYKEYDNFSFAKNDLDIKTEFSYIIESPSKLETKYFYLDFTNDFSNRNIKLEDFPITIRNSFKDDIIKINGYDVSVRRLFIDWKMPLRLRKKWPLILNNKGNIIYIPRYRENFVPKKDDNFVVKI